MTSDSQLQPLVIASLENPLVKLLRRLSGQSSAYRKQGQFWIEGDHLCRAAIERQVRPAVAVMAESFSASMPSAWVRAAEKTVIMPDRLFDAISGLESPAHVGFLIHMEPARQPRRDLTTVVLDRVQDAGNVGSILRSAAAFGVRQVLATQGTAALWSPKVLRAGMGAHFGLELVEGLGDAAVIETGLPLIATSSHEGVLVQHAALPDPCAWVYGHEGQGVGDVLLQRAAMRVRIAQPGGEESLNVAAAAAICLYANSIRQGS